ncbi:MAG: ABC transporter permease [Candidatus Delongbacteria bacterium]
MNPLRPALRDLVRVVRREEARLRPGHLGWALAPLLLFLLLGALYARHQARDLPVGVLDLDRSVLSRQVVRALDATPSLAVTRSVASLEEGLDDLRAGRILGLFELSAGTMSALQAGRPAGVGLYRNTSNLVVGNLLLKDGSAALRTLSLGIALRRQQALGAGASAATRVQPLRLDARSLHNPATDYEFFLVPGLLGALLFMLALLDGVGACSDERARGTLPDLLRAGGDRPLPALLGKALPHLLRQALLAVLLLALVFPLFGIGSRSPWPLLLGWLVLFQWTTLGLACALGLWLPSRLLALEAAVFLGTPAFIFSGYTFPLEAMPVLHRVFARLLPSTPFLEGFIALYQKGAGAGTLAGPLLQLLGFAGLGWGASLWGLRRGAALREDAR